jgi:hypothetical protein
VLFSAILLIPLERLTSARFLWVFRKKTAQHASAGQELTYEAGDAAD